MDPITPDEAVTEAEKLAAEIEADTKAIKKSEDNLTAQRAARAARIRRLADLQNVKGLSERRLALIKGLLIDSTPAHLRKKEAK